MKAALGGLALALLLAGCPTHEFVLQQAEVPWEAKRIQRLQVPAFEAPADAWSTADEARTRIVEALGKGTVAIVEADGKPDAVMHGAFINYSQVTNPAAPRHVLQESNQIQGQVYIWQMDLAHVVGLTLTLRVVGVDGSAVWSSNASGNATETNTVTLDWPGDDPVEPPTSVPNAPDPTTFDRLRHNCLNQALEPLMKSLATRYAYKSI